MAEPIDFPGSNFTFTAPPGRDDIRDLHTFRQHDGPANVSCWRFTPEEIADINRTGCAWLAVFSHRQFFPAFVGSENTTRNVVIHYGSIWHRKPAND